jgi:hypothetical protein
MTSVLITFLLMITLCSLEADGILSLPIDPLAEDGTPVNSLVLGDFSFVPVIKPTGLASTWTPLPPNGYKKGISVLPIDLTRSGDGSYEVGIQVTCQGQTFISDMTKSLIDRKVPEVISTFPAHGGAVDASHDIRAEFDESLDCQLTFASVAVNNEPAVDVAILCAGSTVRVLLDDALVCDLN